MFKFMTMKKLVCCSGLLSAVGIGLAGCATEPTTPQARAELASSSQNQVDRFRQDYPGLQTVLDSSYAYVVFPSMGSGAVIVGGAQGHGQAFQAGNVVGYAEAEQVSVGPQIGGQEYAELLVFRTKAAFDRFTNNNFTFSASASAVILKSGTAAEAKWDDDVAVFQRSEGGAFAGASIGGQRFTYKSAGGGAS